MFFQMQKNNQAINVFNHINIVLFTTFTHSRKS